jgi:hypothetical protein
MESRQERQMSQPIELIATNAAHEIAERLDMLKGAEQALSDFLLKTTGEKLSEADARNAIANGFAEKLLCSIAHNGSKATVRKALAAIGAPHEDDEIWQRLEAAREAQRREEAQVKTQVAD